MLIKRYKIYDRYSKLVQGILEYNEDYDIFKITINKEVPFDKLIISFDRYYKNNHYKLNESESRDWVTERVMPSNRMLVEEGLKGLGLKEYDVFKILVKGKGMCLQDECILIEINENEKENEK